MDEDDLDAHPSFLFALWLTQISDTQAPPAQPVEMEEKVEEPASAGVSKMVVITFNGTRFVFQRAGGTIPIRHLKASKSLCIPRMYPSSNLALSPSPSRSAPLATSALTATLLMLTSALTLPLSLPSPVSLYFGLTLLL